MELHDMIADELFHKKSVSALIWLVQDRVRIQTWNIPICHPSGIQIICLFIMM